MRRIVMLEKDAAHLEETRKRRGRRGETTPFRYGGKRCSVATETAVGKLMNPTLVT
jgi:hypothetical protein